MLLSPVFNEDITVRRRQIKLIMPSVLHILEGFIL